ncbi:MAG TPA: AlpA family phage regulatory protein [Frateuria sp.]|uniref:helix-turn-helix transcriptional regulator n=1 Tax=Frateuria sp. TaxID=2211372 RepID=UPI002D8086AB|nr:AlpA family phage regulatory protein [Frateuria sp.]HET6806011.1 AlpA family phage regulatory protein [Frateuria sp.]
MTDNSTPAHDRIVTYPRIKQEWGITYSNVHLLRLEKAGKFPKRLSLPSVAWLESEIAGWIRERAAARHEVAA